MVINGANELMMALKLPLIKFNPAKVKIKFKVIENNDTISVNLKGYLFKLICLYLIIKKIAAIDNNIFKKAKKIEDVYSSMYLMTKTLLPHKKLAKTSHKYNIIITSNYYGLL